MPPQNQTIEDVYKKMELDMLYSGKSSGEGGSLVRAKQGQEYLSRTPQGGLKSWLERNVGKEKILPLLEFATGAISKEEGQKVSAFDLAIALPFLGRFYKGTRLGLKNIKKAQKIHQSWVDYLQKGGKQTGVHRNTEDALAHHIKLVKEKDIAINSLKGKGNYSGAKNMVNKWRDTHVKAKEWLKVVDKETAERWKGGGTGWQDEWIENYDVALKALDKIYSKSIYK